MVHFRLVLFSRLLATISEFKTRKIVNLSFVLGGLKLSLSPGGTAEDSLRGTTNEHLCETRIEPGH
jgi:hypothetical protein